MSKEKVTYYRGNRWIGRRARPWLKMGRDEWIVLTEHFRLRMQRVPFKGTFCRAAAARECLPGEPVPRVLRQREYPDMRKVARADQSVCRHLAALETNLFREHMAVVEHLCLLQYDDGTPRVPGLLMVSVKGCAWYLTLKDPDSMMQLPVVGVTVDDALDALAVHLGSENAPWEPDAWAMTRKAGRGKK